MANPARTQPERLDRSNVAVVIPALNESLRIREVVEDALAHCDRVIVVDDGSDDATADLVADLDVTVLRHPQRMGKGASLRDGFREAQRQGALGVLTMDGDGQHSGADLPRLLAAANRHPGCLIVGARLRKRASQPWYRRLGNDFGDWGIGVACGFRIVDSQSGQRFYPRSVYTLEDVPGEGFVFEAQLLISAARRVGVGVVAVPIDARYSETNDQRPFRKSHFRLFHDLWRIFSHVAVQALGRGNFFDEYRRARPPAGDRCSGRGIGYRENPTRKPANGMTMRYDTDVAILGGGLAGLTLALQLRHQDAALRIMVLERRAHPVREAAFKVGESTVEIGAHYLADVLGLHEHLDAAQIRKFGFRFFFSEGSTAIGDCTELGVSQLLPTPSWQLDRGRFENFLGERALEQSIDFRDEAVVRGIDFGQGDDPHTVAFEQDGEQHALSARWLVDASGRAGLLKRKLDLAQDNDHDANAVWWRVDGHVDPAGWCDDPAWQQRCTPPDRWRSTNHMCGPGYWAWLIPLASNAHSIGIVCDAKMHPLDTMNTHDKAMAWLREHQPQVAATLEQPGHALQDFAFLRKFSYGCKQVFSGDRWALTGEAGLFLDPFYSPGTDFIAIANTYICDLIAKDRNGEPFAPYAQIYQQLYFSFYENTLTLYQDQYPLMGDAQVLPVKVIWDYTYYWSLLAPLFFAGKLTKVALLGRLRPQFMRATELNLAMQALLRDWGERNAPAEAPRDGRLLDQYAIDWFHEMNRALNDPLDDDAFATRISDNLARMAWLAAEILAQARAMHAGIDDRGLDALLEGAAPAPPSLSMQWYAAA